MHGTVCALIQYTVICICFEFEENKAQFTFPTTKKFDECVFGFVGFSTYKKVKHTLSISNIVALYVGPTTNMGYYFQDQHLAWGATAQSMIDKSKRQ